MQCLGKHPGRAVAMHLKEHRSLNPATLPGEGGVDWRGLFSVIEAQGASEWLIVEHEADAVPPLVAVGKCLAVLITMGR